MNEIIKEQMQGAKQKCYIFDSYTDELICTVYTNEAPIAGEEVIIHSNNEFKHYTVTRRVFEAISGVNVNSGTTVWNLYVNPNKEEN